MTSRSVSQRTRCMHFPSTRHWEDNKKSGLTSPNMATSCPFELQSYLVQGSKWLVWCLNPPTTAPIIATVPSKYIHNWTPATLVSSELDRVLNGIHDKQSTSVHSGSSEITCLGAVVNLAKRHKYCIPWRETSHWKQIIAVPFPICLHTQHVNICCHCSRAQFSVDCEPIILIIVINIHVHVYKKVIIIINICLIFHGSWKDVAMTVGLEVYKQGWGWQYGTTPT